MGETMEMRQNRRRAGAMKTWAEIQTFITENGLPFRVERYNMSDRGTLVDAATGEAIAYTRSKAHQVTYWYSKGFANTAESCKAEVDGGQERKYGANNTTNTGEDGYLPALS
jgi:hypothetical protein